MELFDREGRKLGVFTPEPRTAHYDPADIPHFTAEELDRIEQGPPGRSLTEILDDLEALE